MKKISLLFVVCFLLAACSSEDLMWDFTNYSIAFTVKGESGEDLLDPENEINILDDDITITYKGDVFKLEKGPETRYNMPYKLGLRIEQGREGMYNLTFGEFSPQSDYHDETFMINWGDGTEDEISFSLYIKWKGGNPTIHKKASVNGKLNPDEFLIKISK